MYFMPTEESIARVMKDLGFDRLQAIRHLQSQHLLRQRHRPVQYPLGKSQHFA